MSLAQSYFQRAFFRSSFQTSKQKAYYAASNEEEDGIYDDQKNNYDDDYQKDYHENYVHEESLKNEDSENISRNFFVNALTNLKIFYDCKKCYQNFSSKNVLHKHFKNCLKKFSTIRSDTSSSSSQIVFSNSTSSINFSINTNIRTWHFLTVFVSIDVKVTFDVLCVDTYCGTSMTDRSYIKERLLDYDTKIRQTSSLKIKSIDEIIIFFTECIILNFSFSEIIEDHSAIAKLFREVRLVDNLSAKILIDMNIIEFERMTVNVTTLIIDSCKNIRVNFSAFKTKSSSVKRVVMCMTAIIVSSYISMKISTTLRSKLKLSERDYMFYSDQNARLEYEEEIFSHIVNFNFSSVFVTNSSDNSITISKRSRLRIIKEFDDEDCYMMFSHDAYLASDNWSFTKLKARAMLASSQSESLASKIITNLEITIYEFESAQKTIK